MSEDTTTTTDEETVQAQETEQLENSETQAVQVEENESEDTQDEETTDTTDQTNDEEADDADDADDVNSELLEWAEKKGIKTDDTVALLKMVKESEQKMHSATAEAKALKGAVNTVGEDEGLDDTSQMLNRLQVTEFYLSNPDAKELDEEMAKIVSAKPNLAGDLDLVYELARSRAQATNSVQERQVGRKEALAQVAKAEKAAPPQASATTRQGVAEITDADIANMSATEYKQFKADNPTFQPFG